jgi:rhodanese-related sulfurtransferase
VSPSADDLVADARTRIGRVGPEALGAVVSSGGLVVDIRPVAQRAAEGDLPGALVVERNVLEWRLDPDGAHRLPNVTGPDQQVVVVCSAGYASSLAADSLRALGLHRSADLDGGFQAWAAWSDRASATPAAHPAVSTS